MTSPFIVSPFSSPFCRIEVPILLFKTLDLVQVENHQFKGKTISPSLWMESPKCTPNLFYVHFTNRVTDYTSFTSYEP